MPEPWPLMIYRCLLRGSNAKNWTVSLLWLIPHHEGNSCIKLRKKEQECWAVGTRKRNLNMSKYRATQTVILWYLVPFSLKCLKGWSLCFLSTENLTTSWVKFAGQVLFGGSCRASKALNITSKMSSKPIVDLLVQQSRWTPVYFSNHPSIVGNRQWNHMQPPSNAYLEHCCAPSEKDGRSQAKDSSAQD